MSPFQLMRATHPRLTKTQFRAAIRKSRNVAGCETMSTNQLRHWIEKGGLL